MKTCKCGHQMRLQHQRVVIKGMTYFYDRFICDACKYKRDKQNNINLKRKRKRYDASKERVKMAVDNIKRFLQNETDEVSRAYLATRGLELNKLLLNTF